jgi:hypothetical protein
MRGLLIGWLFLLGWLSGWQVVAQTTPAPPDTLRPGEQTATDSIRVGNSVFTTDSSVIDSSRVTALTPKQEAKRRTIIPRQATIRSLILPGLGQAYNGDYWKMPLVYAGLGTAIYFLIDNNRQYLKFEDGYRRAYNDTTKGAGQGTALVYVRSRGAELELGVNQLKQTTNQYRNYRDLNVIIIVAVWALNAIEANVSAHLKTFDLSDDLTLRVLPSLHPTLGGPTLPGMRLTINFKK